MFDILFGGSRFVARTLGPTLILFAVCLPAYTEIEPNLSPRTITLAVVELVAVTMALAILWPNRFRWAGRAIAGTVGVGWVAFAARTLSRGLSGDDVWKLGMSFLIFGLPGLTYAVRGGRRGTGESLGGTAADAPSADRPDASAITALVAAKLDWFVATNPHLRPEGALAVDGAVWFPKADDTGFDVGIVVTPVDVVVHAELAHVHIMRADPRETAAATVACVTDFLGPDVRLREWLAGGRPYRARLEVHTPEGWRLLDTTGLLVWNYFAPREERTRQNRRLPGRTA